MCSFMVYFISYIFSIGKLVEIGEPISGVPQSTIVYCWHARRPTFEMKTVCSDSFCFNNSVLNWYWSQMNKRISSWCSAVGAFVEEHQYLSCCSRIVHQQLFIYNSLDTSSSQCLSVLYNCLVKTYFHFPILDWKFTLLRKKCVMTAVSWDTIFKCHLIEPIVVTKQLLLVWQKFSLQKVFAT